MPITITPIAPLNGWGYAVPVVVQSDSPGSLLSGGFWHVGVYQNNDFTDSLAQLTVQATSNPQQVNPSPDIGFKNMTLAYFPNDGSTVYLKAIAYSSGFVEQDTGNSSLPFKFEASLYNRISELSTQVSGGFSSSDRSTLNTIESQMTVPVTTAAGTTDVQLRDLLSQRALDTLTTTVLTPVPTGDPVTYNISNQWVYGVIIRIASYPSNWVPFTPDGDYFLQDLAVLTIFRGTDKVKRVPIHTSSHLEQPVVNYGSPLVSILTFGTAPPWTSIEVDWAFGVTGTVQLMDWP